MTLDDLKRCGNCKHYLPSMHGCDFCGVIREELLSSGSVRYSQERITGDSYCFEYCKEWEFDENYKK